MVILVTSVTGGPELLGQLGDGPVVVEAGHGRELAGVEVGRVALRDQGVGVGRVADDEHLDVRLALSLSALPCGWKMPPLADSRSLRSMPALRGMAPTRRA